MGRRPRKAAAAAAAPAAAAPSPEESAVEPDEPEETVHVHSVAADPGGGAAADERPDEGYASQA